MKYTNRAFLEQLGDTIVRADAKAKRRKLRTGPFIVRYAIVGIGVIHLRLFAENGQYTDIGGLRGHVNPYFEEEEVS